MFSSKKLMRRSAMPIAFTLSSLLGVAMVVPAVYHLWVESVEVSESSFFAFAFSGETSAAEGVMRVNDVDPNVDDAEMRVYLRFNFSPLDAGPGVGAESVSRSVPDFGASLVFGGPLAESVTGCDDGRFVVTKGLGYEDLTQDEQRAVIEHYDDAEVGNSEGSNSSETVPTADALVVAAEGTYSVIRPDLWYQFESPWILENDSDERRSFEGFFNYSTCSFGADGFWSAQGVRQVLTFPATSAVSGRLDSDPAIIEASWRVRLVPSAYEDLIRSDTLGTSLRSGGQDFTLRGESWTEPRAAVGLRESTLVFEDRASKQERDVLIFMAGIGVSILGGLLSSLIASVARRRVRPAEPPQEL